MSARRLSLWSQFSNLVLADVLERAISRGVDADMDYSALRKEMAAAYPWGERHGDRYRAWLLAIYRAVGRPGKKKPTIRVPEWSVPDVGDRELSALAMALVQAPDDEVVQAAFCDRLEELGHQALEPVRGVRPSPEQVGKAYCPGAIVRLDRGKWWLYPPRQAKVLVQDIADHIAGKYLLRWSYLDKAERTVRGRMMLTALVENIEEEV